MNRTRFSVCVPLVVAACMFAAATAHAQMHLISINVTVFTDMGSNKKGKEPKKRYLEIKLSNRTSNNYEGLSVRHCIYSRDVATREILIGSEGTSSVALPPLRNTVLKSEPFTFSVTPAKAATSKSAYTPAKGNELAGYSVQVLSDGKVISELFEPTDFKKKTFKPSATGAGQKK